jgi:hypothetical protein
MKNLSGEFDFGMGKSEFDKTGMSVIPSFVLVAVISYRVSLKPS